MSTATLKHPATQIRVANARIDRLKEQLRSTPDDRF